MLRPMKELRDPGNWALYPFRMFLELLIATVQVDILKASLLRSDHLHQVKLKQVREHV